jgi:hypothetical protein
MAATGAGDAVTSVVEAFSTTGGGGEGSFVSTGLTSVSAGAAAGAARSVRSCRLDDGTIRLGSSKSGF